MATDIESTGQWVGPDFRAKVSTQSYASAGAIDGVRFIELRLFGDEGGDFCELTRFAADGALENLPGWKPAQASYSFMEPGTIKGWHLHRHQDDLWFIPPHDRLLVGLLDVREGSPTYGKSMRFAMGAGKCRLLYIPKGVAHGVANRSSVPASMVYFVNRQFDAENPDEHRLPWDLLGAEFWEITPG